MQRAFVTGHTGFTGIHLSDHLESIGYRVIGYSQSDGGDVRSEVAVSGALRDAEPQIVFHLVAPPKTADALELYSVSVLGTVALLEASAKLPKAPIVVIVGSSAVYGAGSASTHITEQWPLRPVTNHGASKAAQEAIAWRYLRAFGLRVMVARTFNLVGPGMPRSLAVGSFVSQVTEIERLSDHRPLKHGDLRSIRDFIDVRDAVRAYVAIGRLGQPGDAYNVCSGRGITLHEVMEKVIRGSRVTIATQFDPTRAQAGDVPAQVGSFRRLHRATGWEPLIDLERSIADTLESARQEKHD
jgi:GDP-4-dehydro-6-deoxy-D-mannose reductase